MAMFESFKQVSLNIDNLNDVKVIEENTSRLKSPMEPYGGGDLRKTWSESKNCHWTDTYLYQPGKPVVRKEDQNKVCGQGMGFGYWTLANTNWLKGFGRNVK